MFFVSLFTACAVIKQTDSIVGVYKARTISAEWVPSVKATLTLRQDGTFDVKSQSIERRRAFTEYYIGKWKVIDENRIWLDFDEITDMLILIGPYAVSYQDREADIISKNEIKTDNIVFKRIKRRP